MSSSVKNQTTSLIQIQIPDRYKNKVCKADDDGRRSVQDLAAVGVGSGLGSEGLGQFSPYLNVDPSLLQNTPTFLQQTPTSDTETKRGKLEKSFTALYGFGG